MMPPHAEHAACRLAADRKRLRQDLVGGGAFGKARLESGRLGNKLFIGIREVLFLQRIHTVCNGLHATDLVIRMRAEDL